MARPERKLRLRSSARSDRGRVRQNNEDSVHLWAEEHSILAVVADGMGGAVAGEEASRIAVETIQGKLTTENYRNPEDYRYYDAEDLADLMSEAVRAANQNIISKQVSAPELKGMGTTVTMAFARYGSVILAHVGDSRAYHIDGIDGSIQQLTSDHSFVQALIDAGHITEEEAQEHPMRNVLYRALGQSEDLDVDTLNDIDLHSGDRMVLCSDGLTLHVTPEEIANAATSASDPAVIADKLVDMANSRGGKDNISVVVIVVDEDPDTQTDTLDESTQSSKPITNLNPAQDESTVPLDQAFFNLTRVQKSLDSAPPASPEAAPPTEESTSETSPDADPKDPPTQANYGEGRDTMEPIQ
jgi:protein phosphatase